MSELPKLRTSSTMQYPLGRTQARRVRILRFVDGAEQRFPLDGQAFRQWQMSFSQLDDAERNILTRFLEDQMATSGAITVVDPSDGLRYERCHVEGEDAEVQLNDANDGRIDFVLSEDPD